MSTNPDNADYLVVLRIRDDSKDAFRLLYDRYSKKLYYFSLRYLCDQDEAEELVQSVFIKYGNTVNHWMETCL